MAPPSVTIITTVYNGAKHLTALLNSIIAQTSNKWCCILVDDGSTDESPNVLSSYANMDSRFHIITQTNHGCGEARNVALKHVDTQYVMFADQERWHLPERAVYKRFLHGFHESFLYFLRSGIQHWPQFTIPISTACCLISPTSQPCRNFRSTQRTSDLLSRRATALRSSLDDATAGQYLYGGTSSEQRRHSQFPFLRSAVARIRHG